MCSIHDIFTNDNNTRNRMGVTDSVLGQYSNECGIDVSTK